MSLPRVILAVCVLLLGGCRFDTQLDAVMNVDWEDVQSELGSLGSTTRPVSVALKMNSDEVATSAGVKIVVLRARFDNVGPWHRYLLIKTRDRRRWSLFADRATRPSTMRAK